MVTLNDLLHIFIKLFYWNIITWKNWEFLEVVCDLRKSLDVVSLVGVWMTKGGHWTDIEEWVDLFFTSCGFEFFLSLVVRLVPCEGQTTIRSRVPYQRVSIQFLSWISSLLLWWYTLFLKDDILARIWVCVCGLQYSRFVYSSDIMHHTWDT